MTPRMRVAASVAAAALAAAGGVVAVTLLTTRGEHRSAPQQAVRPGAPPLVLDLGVRFDAQARALRRAATLYDRGHRRASGTVFARYRSLEASVGSALAAWPRHTVARLTALAQDHPRSALVRLHLGLALYWSGRSAAAQAAWRAAARVQPDSASAVRADDLLHPRMPRGLPTFVPGFPPPSGLARLRPDRQLAALERRARRGGVRERLLYGVALQRLGRPVSAEREFAAAAARAPGDPEAQVAAAVGLFDKDHPERAFARLGPLTRRFPRAATVRFHLGLLLLWRADVRTARHQFELARKEAPGSPLANEARRFLKELRGVRTK